MPAARSSIYLALHLSARLCARGRAHKGRSGPPVSFCANSELNTGEKRKKKKRCRAADCPLTETACSSAPGNKWLRWLIFLPSTIYNCLLFMCAGWKKHNLQRDRIQQCILTSTQGGVLCRGAVHSAGWEFGCRAALWWRSRIKSEGGRKAGRDKKKAINLAESDRASANTSTLNSLSHHPPHQKKKRKRKAPGGALALQLDPHFTPCCVFSGQPVPSHAPVPLQPICSAPF